MAKSSKKRGAQLNIALDASKQKEFNQRIKKATDNVKEYQCVPGVVYVSHLPWGFEEKPLREYFQQFGSIKQLRVSRSKKTGNCRGFAYIQFGHDEVAKIVADTMNNYLMFGKLIKCKHLQKPHPGTFKNAHRHYIKPGGVAGAIAKHNSEKSDASVEKSQKRMMGKLAKLEAKLALQGIKYKLEDPKLKKVKKDLKIKAEARKMIRAEQNKKASEKKDKKAGKKNLATSKTAKTTGDDDDDDDDDNDEDDDDSDEEDESDDTEVVITPAKQQKREKTNNDVKSKVKSSGPSENKSAKKTGKRQSLIPKEVDTPKGKMNVLIEDSSEEEVSFKTPPCSIKSSKLPDSIMGTPKTAERRTSKRKLNEKIAESKTTPASTGKRTPAATGKRTPAATGKRTPAATGKRTPAATGKRTPAATGKKTPASTGKNTPASTEKKVKLTPGLAQKMDKVGSSKKKKLN